MVGIIEVRSCHYKLNALSSTTCPLTSAPRPSRTIILFKSSQKAAVVYFSVATCLGRSFTDIQAARTHTRGSHPRWFFIRDQGPTFFFDDSYKPHNNKAHGFTPDLPDTSDVRSCGNVLWLAEQDRQRKKKKLDEKIERHAPAIRVRSFSPLTHMRVPGG